MNTNFHHIAISVRNLEASQAFYEQLGFKEVHHWDADDRSVIIVHLKLSAVVLELFAYAKNKDIEPLELKVANNPPAIGVKHFGVSVPDVHAAFDSMKREGYTIGNPEVVTGRTDVLYFFVKDPDGMWVEIVQDDRGY